MKNNPSSRALRGQIPVCLLFILFHLSLAAQTKFCPPYPRTMDQALVCLEFKDDIAMLKLDQRAIGYNPVRFVFPSFMVAPSPASTTLEILSLSVDFADGMGTRTVTSGSTVTITYPGPGQYSLIYEMNIRINADAILVPGDMIFQSNINSVFTYPVPAPNALINAIGETYTPPANAYPPGSPYNNPIQAGGKVSIQYANPADQTLRKPFIIVEGFDPIINTPEEYVVNNVGGTVLGYGNVRWDVLLTGRNESFDEDPTEAGVPHTPQFALFPSFISQLRSRGYDLVFVDFANAGTYIQANANFLTEVIETLNSEKVGSEENVLMGLSMGGIVARYALAKMEAEGKSHCTGTFFTFDTPHNGANIPLALQALGWFYHAINQTDELWTALNSPAGQQQTLSSLGEELLAGKVSIGNNIWSYVTPLSFSELTSQNPGALRSNLQNELAGVGWPKIPRKLALLDGMKNGTLLSNQGFGPGGKFYDASIYSNAVNFGTVFKISMRSSTSVSSESYALNCLDNCLKQSVSLTVNNALFVVGQPHDFNPCNPLTWGSDKIPINYYAIHLIANADLPALDNAPGGLRTDLRTLHARLKANAFGNVTFNNPVNLPLLSFVPTWSSLAMSTPLNNQNLFVDLDALEFKDFNLPNLKVPNFDNFYAPSANLRHVELDAGGVDFILAELDALGTNLAGGNLMEEYNYGFRQKEIPNTQVLAGGKLNVNNTGATGLVQTAPGISATKPVFTTYLNDCGQSIVVENGGQYNIGAMNKSQHGITEVWDGASVHIKTGGILHISSDQSMLWIKPGATLTLDAGAIIYLESPESNIRIEGNLVWNGNIVFSNNGTFSKGFFDFRQSHTLTLGDNVDAFRLHGFLKNQRFIRIDAGATLVIPIGKGIDLQQGAIEHYGKILLGTGGSANFRSNRIYGDNDSNIGIEGTNTANFTMFDCNFDGTYFPIKLMGATNQFTNLTQIRLTTFQNYSLNGVEIRNRGGVLYENCQFKGEDASGSGVISKFNLVTILRNCTLQDHQYPGTIQTGDPLDGLQASVIVDGDWVFWMDGGEIRDGVIGILNNDANDAAPVNVFMNNQATIRDCYAGVAMRGNATIGQVIMDCARLINNEYGIYGEDAGLMISPLLMTEEDGEFHNPNVFIRNGTAPGTAEYIHVCYKTKTPVMPLPAKGNFWGNYNGVITGYDSSPDDHIWLGREIDGQLCNRSFFTNIALPPVLPPLVREPMACLFLDDELTGPNPDECTLATLVPNVTVRDKYRTGMDEIKTEQFDVAQSTFNGLSAQWQQDMSNLNKACQTFLQSAKSLADGSGFIQQMNGDRRSQTVSNNLLLWPNPTSGMVTIQSSPDLTDLRAWDAYGRLVLNVKGSNHFDAADWAPGIYFVEIRETNGDRIVARLIVE